MHQFAHGVSIHDNKIDKFLKYANESLKDIDFQEDTYEVDFEITQQDNIGSIIESIGDGNYLWGQGINEPVLAFKNISIDKRNLTVMGKDKTTLKFSVGDVVFLKFKDTEFIDKVNTMSSPILTCIGTANINKYYGSITPQVFIQDYNLRDGKFDF